MESPPTRSRKLPMKALIQDEFERNVSDNAYFLAYYFETEQLEIYNRTMETKFNDPLFSGLRNLGVIALEHDVNNSFPDFFVLKVGKIYSELNIQDSHTIIDRYNWYSNERISRGETPVPIPDLTKYLPKQTFNISIQQDLLTEVSRMPVGNFFMTMFGVGGLDFQKPSGRSAHANILIIHKVNPSEYVLQRFEPNYDTSYTYGVAVGIYSLMNTSKEDFINQALAQAFQNLLGGSVRYERYVPTSCPNIGPQLVESGVMGFDEEVKGYCFYWSMALLFEIINLIAKSTAITLDQILEEANKNLTIKIQSKAGNNYGEKTKTFIREFTGERLLEIFKQDALKSSFNQSYGWKMMKFVHKTISYPHVVEILLRKMSEGVGTRCKNQIFPTRFVVESWPWDEFVKLKLQPIIEALRRGKVYNKENLNGFYEFFEKIDDKVYRILINEETIDNPKDLRVGILILKDNTPGGLHAEKDIEHINAIVLQKKDKIINLRRFEPQYKGDETNVKSMINLSPDSHWNKSIVSVFSYLYNFGVPDDEKITIVYNPVQFDTCPAIGSYGPQYFEYAEPREESEHIGYCQTWSFVFLEKFLRKLCHGGPSSRFSLKDIIEEVYVEAGVSALRPGSGEYQKRLYLHIKEKASGYCKMLFDEVYAPYFRVKEDPNNPFNDIWRRNLEMFEQSIPEPIPMKDEYDDI